MKKIFALMGFVLFSAAPLMASWNNATDSIQGTRVSVKKEGGNMVFLELIPGKPATIVLAKKTSTRWKISADAKGVLTLFKDGAAVQSKVIAKGENDIKIFLEPGKYQLKTTIGAQALCFFWKKRKLTSLVPDGGGFATYMQSGDQKFAYYRATQDTLPILTLTGPTIAYVFFRADIPKGATKAAADVSVKENDSIVEHKVSDLAKSEKAGPSEDSTQAISEAMVLHLTVGEGPHKYSIRANKCTGYVKFYKTEKKKKKFAEPTGSLDPSNDADPADANGEDLSEADVLDEGNEVVAAKAGAKPFRFSASVGAYYDDNVYRYSPGYRDTFDLGLKSYRYPGIQQLDDFVMPIEARAYATRKRLTAGAGVSVDAYGSNSKLNTLGTHLSLSWSGPVKVRVAYRFTPYDPVRPTYFAPRSYLLMRYSENKGSFSAELQRRWLRPGVEFSFGYFDYNQTFDNYDAYFYAGGLALARAKPLGFKISVDVGAVSAKHHTFQDWTNRYASLGGDLHVPLRAILLGAKGSVMKRDYSTSDPLDTHFQRKEWSGENFLYMKYSWRDFAVSTRFGNLWRAASSPIPAIDEEKDFQALKGGLEFSWDTNV